MSVPVNEVVYNTSISLNMVFVFAFVNWVRFGAPPKDPAQKGFVVFWDFRETGQFPSQTTTLFTVCQENHLRINLEKCYFFKEEIEYFGFDVGYGWFQTP